MTFCTCFIDVIPQGDIGMHMYDPRRTPQDQLFFDQESFHAPEIGGVMPQMHHALRVAQQLPAGSRMAHPFAPSASMSSQAAIPGAISSEPQFSSHGPQDTSQLPRQAPQQMQHTYESLHLAQQQSSLQQRPVVQQPQQSQQTPPQQQPGNVQPPPGNVQPPPATLQQNQSQQQQPVLLQAATSQQPAMSAAVLSQLQSLFQSLNQQPGGSTQP
jgi:hypothetical protein